MAPNNTYDIGDVVRCQATFTNSAGTALDPTGLTFKFKTPAGVVTTYTYGVDGQLLRTTTGVYYVDLNVTIDGIWHYRFDGTGSGQGASENRFYARESNII